MAEQNAIGIIGLDTSHSVAFARIMNDPEQSAGTQVEGARITHAWAAKAKGNEATTIDERRQELTDRWGVTMVRKPAELISQVDAVMLLSVNGSEHLKLAKPFIDRGIPLFIDKPLANTVGHARTLTRMASTSTAPVMSCSALRYAEEVQEAVADAQQIGWPFGGCVSGPGTHKEGIPGPFFYGIHSAEMVQTLFGTGIESVRCEHSVREDATTIYYRDGRTPLLRFVRAPEEKFWFSVSSVGGSRASVVEKSTFYLRMLERVVEMIRTGRSPVPMEDSFEVIALLEAIDRSGNKRGSRIKLATL